MATTIAPQVEGWMQLSGGRIPEKRRSKNSTEVLMAITWLTSAYHCGQFTEAGRATHNNVMVDKLLEDSGLERYQSPLLCKDSNNQIEGVERLSLLCPVNDVWQGVVQHSVNGSLVVCHGVGGTPPEG